MKIKVKYLGFLLLIFMPAAAYSEEVAGVNVPENITLNNVTLKLNGAGIRTKFFFDIYVGALYLPQTTKDPAQVISMSGPKRVLMHFLYDEVSKEKLVDGWNDGFEDNLTEAELASLTPKIKAFNDLFESVKRGDYIELDYLPDTGTRVSINNSIKGSVEGKEFYSALLKIWIGEDPVDSSLKQAMLNQQ